MTKIRTQFFQLTFVAVFFLGGCSHTKLITLEDSPFGVDTLNTAAANRLLAGRTVELVLPSGQEQTVSDVFLCKDSLSFLAEGKTLRSSLSLHEVRVLQDKDYVLGAILGGTVGFAGGFAVGYTCSRISSGGGAGPEADVVSLWAGNPWVNWGATLGGLIGLGIGASNGIGTEYQILYTRTAADSLLQSAQSNE